MKLYNEARELVSSERAAEVEKRYTEFYEKLKASKSVTKAITEEEIAAAGSEDGAWIKSVQNPHRHWHRRCRQGVLPHFP